MTSNIIFNALRLPEANVKLLIAGAVIAIIPPEFFELGRRFALYPESDLETIKIEAWAKWEDYQRLDKTTSLDVIALHIGYPLEFLQASLDKSESIYLAYLRVYRLPTPIEITPQSMGDYVYLANTLYISDLLPVVSDRDFEVQKQRLLKLEPPESPFEKIERKLKEAELQQKIETSKNLDWIKTITTLGDRSIEQDQGKNTYQAGTDFENISKQGLEFLGFTIDESHKGGAGGLDLFCSKPYPLTGECKAGKSIPNRTVEELIRLGGTHLGVEGFINLSAKLVIGAGNPTNPMLNAAHQWKVSIIKAMTLQKLVELKAKYDGAIDLFELKKYLQAGQIDDKIHEYIQKVESEIKLRSHIVQIVKEEQYGDQYVSVTEIRSTYNAKYATELTQRLSDPVVKDLLIELSSPLAGYLGRVEEGGKKCDRFYYLRDLPIEKET